MSTINFTCPCCSFSKQIPASAEGQQGSCPSCGSAVTIRADAAAVPNPRAKKKKFIFAAIAVSTVGIVILCIGGSLFVYFFPQGDGVTGSIEDERQLQQSSGLSSFEELCNTFVSAIKSQDPEKLVALSYFPSLRDWNDYVTESTDELIKDPDTTLIAKRTRLHNTLDAQSYKSLEMRHEDAMHRFLETSPSLRQSSYVAKFLTKGSSGPDFVPIVKSMTFVIKSDDTSFWEQDRYFATVLVSIENVLVSIQFVACVDGDRKWWLCSDKFVVQLANSSYIDSIIEANNHESQREVVVSENAENIDKALMFLADHPTPRTRWDWFNNTPKSYKRLTEVSGVVTYDGTPLAGATIAIMPDGGDGTAKPADGKTDAQGNFNLVTTFPDGAIIDGALEGAYTLFVIKFEQTYTPVDDPDSGSKLMINEIYGLAYDRGSPWDDPNAPPVDGADPMAEMMAMMGDDLDPSSKSLIHEIFGLAYTTEKDWSNRCFVGANESPTTLKITLSSDGVGKIVVVTK